MLDQDLSHVTLSLDAGYPAGTVIGLIGGAFTKAVAGTPGAQIVGAVVNTTTVAGPATVKLLNSGGTIQFLAGEAIDTLDCKLTVGANGEVFKNGPGEIVGIPLETVADAARVTAIPRVSQDLQPVTAVTAAGSNQGDAAALARGFNVVTGADGTKGVILPTAAPGLIVTLKGVTAGVLKVYPATGATINGLSANAAISLASGLIPATFQASSATQWYTLPLVPS